MKMRIKPVKSYKSPRYPTRELFIDNPELLGEYTPFSWKTKAVVAGALMAFVFAGCGKNLSSGKDSLNKAGMTQTSQVKQITPIKEENESKTSTKEEIKKQKVVNYKIAPVFVHGDGTGAAGCIVMSPPVFMSEESARKIIENELGKHNISIQTNDKEIEDVKIKAVCLSSNSDWNIIDEKAVGLKTSDLLNKLTIDGYNKKYNTGYVFVSIKDYDKLTKSQYLSTVTEWYLKNLAYYIRDNLKKANKMNAVVFYDPSVLIDFSNYDRSQRDKARKKSLKESKKLLRQQVRDFISWGKKEGIFDKVVSK